MARLMGSGDQKPGEAELHIRQGKPIRFDPDEINTWIMARKKPAS
jgi:hypothetical protein